MEILKTCNSLHLNLWLQHLGLSKKVKKSVSYFQLFCLKFFSVVPSSVLEIFDGNDVTYADNISVICTENHLINKYSGWKLNLTKSLDELEALTRFILTKSFYNIRFRFTVFKGQDVTSANL